MPVLTAAILAAALAFSQANAPAATPAESLTLTRGQASVVLSPADFRSLPHVHLEADNNHTHATENYSGVLLTTLLQKINAPIGKDLRGKAMTTYIVAIGSDGYAVVLSLAEVDPDFRDAQVIVADAKDNQPLGKNGPYQLIVPEDKRPARWVHNLVSIRLKSGE